MKRDAFHPARPGVGLVERRPGQRPYRSGEGAAIVGPALAARWNSTRSSAHKSGATPNRMAAVPADRVTVQLFADFRHRHRCGVTPLMVSDPQPHCSCGSGAGTRPVRARGVVPDDHAGSTASSRSVTAAWPTYPVDASRTVRAVTLLGQLDTHVPVTRLVLRLRQARPRRTNFHGLGREGWRRRTIASGHGVHAGGSVVRSIDGVATRTKVTTSPFWLAWQAMVRPGSP